MFIPVTSRLDTQIEATKKLKNKGVKEGDPLPEYPIEPEDGGDEMPDFEPPPPINETQTEDEDEYEMPDFDPPPPIDEAQTEDEDEMLDFDPPPSIERMRKEWSPSSINKNAMRRDTAPDSDREEDEWEGGKKLYDGNDMHKISFIKGLLEFSDDFSRTVATIFNWYLDDRAVLAGDLRTAPKTGAIKRAELFSESKDVYGIIPLNRFSFFQELRDKMLPPMQIELNITLNDDREIIYRVAGDETRYVIQDFQLWLPRLNFTSAGQIQHKESVSDDPKQLLFHYRLNVQATDNYMIYAVVLYEERIVIDKIGNELIVM
ncbi:hypothetical protein ACROYT_G030817 [Oculina patagonica]